MIYSSAPRLAGRVHPNPDDVPVPPARYAYGEPYYSLHPIEPCDSLHTPHVLPQPDSALTSRIPTLASSLDNCRAPWPFQTGSSVSRGHDHDHDHDDTGTERGTRAALIAVSDAKSIFTIRRKQRRRVPRSTVN